MVIQPDVIWGCLGQALLALVFLLRGLPQFLAVLGAEIAGSLGAFTLQQPVAFKLVANPPDQPRQILVVGS